MGNIIFIISIIVGLVILLFVNVLLSGFFKVFPALKYILIGIVALIIGYTRGLWAGLIVGLIALAWFIYLEEKGGNKCNHCGSYNTDELEITQDLIDSLNWTGEKPSKWEIKKIVKCNKCKNCTAFLNNN